MEPSMEQAEQAEYRAEIGAKFKTFQRGLELGEVAEDFKYRLLPTKLPRLTPMPFSNASSSTTPSSLASNLSSDLASDETSNFTVNLSETLAETRSEGQEREHDLDSYYWGPNMDLVSEAASDHSCEQSSSSSTSFPSTRPSSQLSSVESTRESSSTSLATFSHFRDQPLETARKIKLGSKLGSKEPQFKLAGQAKVSKSKKREKSLASSVAIKAAKMNSEYFRKNKVALGEGIDYISAALEEASIPPNFKLLFELYGLTSLEDYTMIDSDVLDDLEDCIGGNNFHGRADMSSKTQQMIYLGHEICSSKNGKYSFANMMRRKILSKLQPIVLRLLQEKKTLGSFNQQLEQQLSSSRSHSVSPRVDSIHSLSQSSGLSQSSYDESLESKKELLQVLPFYDSGLESGDVGPDVSYR